MRDRLNSYHERNMSLMKGLFEQLYDPFLEFCSYTPAQRYQRLLERHPRITDIASYGDIVSYLNISRRQLQLISERQSMTFRKMKYKPMFIIRILRVDFRREEIRLPSIMRNFEDYVISYAR